MQPVVVFRTGDTLRLGATAGLPQAMRARLEAGFLEVDPLDASSSGLRERLEAGEDTGDALPARLREYALDKGIYTGS